MADYDGTLHRTEGPGRSSEELSHREHPQHCVGRPWGGRQDFAGGGPPVPLRSHHAGGQDHRGQHRLRLRRGGDQAPDLGRHRPRSARMERPQDQRARRSRVRRLHRRDALRHAGRRPRRLRRLGRRGPRGADAGGVELRGGARAAPHDLHQQARSRELLVPAHARRSCARSSARGSRRWRCRSGREHDFRGVISVIDEEAVRIRRLRPVRGR